MSMVDPAQGAPPTGEEGNSPPGDDPSAEIARLKQENAELRDARRKDRASAAGAQFGLDPTTTELLAQLPADQIEDRAKAIAEARGLPTDGDGAPNPATPPQDAPDATTLAAMAAMQQTSGKGNEPAGGQKSLRQQLEAEVSNAGSLEEVQAIQSRYIQLAHEKGDASLFNL